MQMQVHVFVPILVKISERKVTKMTRGTVKSEIFTRR